MRLDEIEAGFSYPHRLDEYPFITQWCFHHGRDQFYKMNTYKIIYYVWFIGVGIFTDLSRAYWNSSLLNFFKVTTTYPHVKTYYDGNTVLFWNTNVLLFWICYRFCVIDDFSLNTIIFWWNNKIPNKYWCQNHLQYWGQYKIHARSFFPKCKNKILSSFVLNRK